MEAIKHLYDNMAAHWIWGAVLGIFTYLIKPSAAFYALWIAVGFDLLTKIIYLSVESGGFLTAIKTQKLNSKTMFHKAFIKVVSYFILTVLAYQSRYIVAIEAVPILFSTIIYMILFLVEVHSIIENLIGAGCDDIKPLLMRFENEKKKAIEGTGNIVSDVAQARSQETDERTLPPL